MKVENQTREVQIQDVIDYVYRFGDLSYKRRYSSESIRNVEAYLDYNGMEYYFDESIELDIQVGVRNVVVQGKVSYERVNYTVITHDEHSGKLLAYMLSVKIGAKHIHVKSFIGDTYGEAASKILCYEASDLEAVFLEAVNQYLKYIDRIEVYIKERAKSLGQLDFPYDSIREGQNKLMKTVEDVIDDGGRLFCRAPTGIGKTLGTLYPCIKALLKQDYKIFYLTAKNEGKQLIQDTIEQLSNKGLVLKCIRLTAKQKMCFKKGRCDLERCSYAKAYFDKINKALGDLFKTSCFYDEKVIKKVARDYHMCPYELSLDLSMYCDVVICDYNHVFDPQCKLKRYFSDECNFKSNREYIYLIDEAHNLETRARNMFSASLSKKKILRIIRRIDEESSYYDDVLDKFSAPSEDMLQNGSIVLEGLSNDFVKKVRRLIQTTEIFIKNQNPVNQDTIREDVHELKRFLNLYQHYDETYKMYLKNGTDEVQLNLLCLDPSKQIRQTLDMAKATVMFSATLTPIESFKRMLGGEDHDKQLELTSPFDPDRFKLIVHHGISVRYQDRERESIKIAESIKTVVEERRGNYLVFFSSYVFMEIIKDAFVSLTMANTEVITQKKGDDTKQRAVFVDKFRNSKKSCLVGFAVLGGSFGEGLDLKGESLIGAIIVGQGLPPVSIEKSYIKDFFDKKRCDGYLLSYRNPGFNKVMQAAGRVIRSESDKGVVVLIGERFITKDYLRLYPKEWRNISYVNRINRLRIEINDFWTKYV